MAKVAIVTGATRGIGKASALALARQGFDIVATGRTLREGEGRVNTPYAHDLRQVPVPGSLETTAADVRALGRDVITVQMDVLDRTTMDEVVAETMRQWGRIDLLLNNALHSGPGLMYPFDTFAIDQLEKSALGNLVNQAYMTQLVLRVMLKQRQGIIIGLSSAAATMPPPVPVRKGGWGFVYGGPKSGFHRISEFVHVEHHEDGILAFNVEPGFTVTEATVAMFGPDTRMGQMIAHGTKPEVTGNVVAWLATQPEAREFAGKLISTPTFFKERGIVFP
jgi:NAD(P)-dependent dehydrogenase (short-subunit alcohol dehydrogenase family)